MDFFKVRILRDKRGNPIEETYLDEKGNPVTTVSGYTTVKYRLDDQGDLSEMAFYDAADHLVRSVAGYAKVQYRYNKKGQVEEILYFGPNGQPEYYGETYVREKLERNAENKLTRGILLDKDGHPVRSHEGYAIAEYGYEGGKRTSGEFFDEFGKPTLHKDGYAKILVGYNPQGLVALRKFFDLEGNLTITKSGYAQVAYTYNARGWEETVRYLGVQGESALHQDGYAEIHKEYSNDGRLIAESYFGLDGEPTLVNGGFAKASYLYKQNKLVEESYYDTQGKLVRIALGYARKTTAYDEFGRATATEFFDADGSVVQTQVTIIAVEPSRKREEEDFQADDILLSYDGEQLVTVKQWTELERTKGNFERTLQVRRAGKVLSLKVSPGLILGVTVEDRVSSPDTTWQAVEG